MRNTTKAVCISLFLAGCATSSSTHNPFSNSAFKPKEELDSMYQVWLHHVAEEYQCTNPKVIQVLPLKASGKDVTMEKWVTDACGKTKSLYPIRRPDGSGGYQRFIGRDSV
jgi:hypothetical protein